jgi:hypothetical protein
MEISHENGFPEIADTKPPVGILFLFGDFFLPKSF